jgi:hypothetical protein
MSASNTQSEPTQYYMADDLESVTPQIEHNEVCMTNDVDMTDDVDMVNDTDNSGEYECQIKGTFASLNCLLLACFLFFLGCSLLYYFVSFTHFVLYRLFLFFTPGTLPSKRRSLLNLP